MKKTTKENKFRNKETMIAIAEIITAQKEFCKLYSLTSANMNSNVDKSNRVTIIAESVELSKQIIESMRLQNDFFNAVSRITVWVDSNAIVIYVGAVFAVHAKLAKSEKAKDFAELFNKSIDKKYNERKLKNKTITALTETRHTFDSVDDFKAFFVLLAELVTVRKKALSETEKAQKEKAQKATETKKETKKEKAQKETEKVKQLTKEVINAMQKAK